MKRIMSTDSRGHIAKFAVMESEHEDQLYILKVRLQIDCLKKL